MKYIVYEYIAPYLFNPSKYDRYELKNDKEFYKEAESNSKYISEYYSKEHVSEIWKNFYLDIYNKVQ